MIVEARTVGADDWTTLPEAGGLTNTTLPAECEAGFLLDEHPFLSHYLTPGDPCTPTGTTGDWNRMTGNSGGWQQVSFDLSGYAGEQVEVKISYVTDPSTGGVGVFVDDTRSWWTGPRCERGLRDRPRRLVDSRPPAGQPAGRRRLRASEALLSGAVTTEDSVLLGFGLEQIGTAAERAAMVRRAMQHLLGGSAAATATR